MAPSRNYEKERFQREMKERKRTVWNGNKKRTVHNIHKQEKGKFVNDTGIVDKKGAEIKIKKEMFGTNERQKEWFEM